jgi:electron transport complex protein RnfC
MQGMLDEARSQQADNVEKLERAVAKNHDRVQRAQQALDQARKQVAEEPASSQ